MTDKQIIIDGINVSGCCQYMPRYMEDYDIDTLDYCNRYFKPCKDVDVKYCYYKQLKHKEQECEALQMSDNEAREIVAELKAECKELKEKVKELNQGWIDCDKERNLQEANSEFRQRVINRYKQTLTEIKEIAEENIRISESEGLNGVYRRGLAEQILQKISEVLDDRAK